MWKGTRLSAQTTWYTMGPTVAAFTAEPEPETWAWAKPRAVPK
eukprot:CAMPEP_0171070006 /NCGR_PEP_ID=MMETSP0766_2-20121228/9486_1 /TAXON_ID=439317 /ORGANISM="Gambierdiscus australes, Strain CAWD 149" /LENGTH=42 /DNA_ID= /DNA_START= /DNA_END= /DNA_ORIENTATION=